VEADKMLYQVPGTNVDVYANRGLFGMRSKLAKCIVGCFLEPMHRMVKSVDIDDVSGTVTIKDLHDDVILSLTQCSAEIYVPSPMGFQ
jgi:hypothetical protein